jgi:hypothetical protein
MKVSGIGGSSRIGGPVSASARPASGGFALSGLSAAGETAAAARAANVSGVGSVEALIALQQVDGPLERRRRAMGRASRLLDVLDQIKLALLDGDLDAGALEKLSRAIREERSATEDPRLEDLLNEIETRAAVEQAKLEVARAA